MHIIRKAFYHDDSIITRLVGEKKCSIFDAGLTEIIFSDIQRFK